MYIYISIYIYIYIYIFIYNKLAQNASPQWPGRGCRDRGSGSPKLAGNGDEEAQQGCDLRV